MTYRRSLRAAALLALAAGTPAMAQFTTNGRIDATEASLYGAPKWVQTTPTFFGDNFSGAGAGAGDVGTPSTVTTGIEIAIPFSALGTAGTPYTGGSIRLALMVNGGDRGFLSNQVLGGLPLNLPNLGEPRNVNFGAFVGNQFVATFTPFANSGANPVIDGTLDTGLYGPNRSTQTNYTGFGNADHGQLVRRVVPSTSEGSELDNIRVGKKGTTLYIFIGGNLEANFNKLELFVDSIAGGQNRLVSGNPDPVNRLSDDGTGNGLQFDIGFDADFYVTMNGGNTAAEGVPENNQIFVNYCELPTAGGGLAFFCGGTTYGSPSALTGGDAGAPAIVATVNNANVGGVIGTEVGGANAAPNVDRAYGTEMDGLFSYVDATNMKLHVLVTGNVQNNFNKYDLFVDCAPGGQNRLRGGSQQLTTSGGSVVFYSGNGRIDFNGLNRMGALTLALSDPMNELSSRVPVDGLKFDDAFAADYWISFTNGINGAVASQFTNVAPLRTDGIARNFAGAPLDFSCFDGGDKPTNNPILFDGDGAGGGYSPLTGFEPFDSDPQGRFAPRHLGEFIPSLPAPTAGLLIASIDNSNVGGVTALSGANAASVTTGVELEIDLRELGWDGMSPILMAGFVNGSGHDFVANQVLGGLPAGNTAAGGYDDRNIGEPRTADFALIAGDQFVNLTGITPPSCPPDFNGDGNLDPDDLADYIGAFFSVPAPISADFNGDGSVDPDDLADYIGAFFTGCQ